MITQVTEDSIYVLCTSDGAHLKESSESITLIQDKHECLNIGEKILKVLEAKKEEQEQQQREMKKMEEVNKKLEEQKAKINVALADFI